MKNPRLKFKKIVAGQKDKRTKLLKKQTFLIFR
jgi:hypothetical protein